LEEETVCYSHHRHPNLLSLLADHNSSLIVRFQFNRHFARSLTTTSAQHTTTSIVSNKIIMARRGSSMFVPPVLVLVVVLPLLPDGAGKALLVVKRVCNPWLEESA
jgi:hypothetical protein